MKVGDAFFESDKDSFDRGLILLSFTVPIWIVDFNFVQYVRELRYDRVFKSGYSCTETAGCGHCVGCDIANVKISTRDFEDTRLTPKDVIGSSDLTPDPSFGVISSVDLAVGP